MGELVQLGCRLGSAWPKLAKGTRRTLLRIRHAEEQRLPGGAHAICHSANCRPALMLLSNSWGRMRERNLRPGRIVPLTDGVTLQVIASAVPDSLLLLVLDSRPEMTVATGDRA